MYADGDFPKRDAEDIVRRKLAHGGPCPSEVEWVRVGDVGCVFGRGPAPAGAQPPLVVRQGEVDDCWLLSALATVAARWTESEIQRKIVHQHAETPGKVTVVIHRCGRPVPVEIDDSLPFYGGHSVGVTCGGGFWWVALVEKAFAKVNGGYSKLSGGLEVDALVDLTGWGGGMVGMRGEGMGTEFGGLEEIVGAKGGFVGLSCLKDTDASVGEGGDANPEGEQIIRATVSIHSSRPPYALTFTLRDCPRSVAASFVAQHQLPIETIDSLVPFVASHQAAASRHLSAPAWQSRPSTTKSPIPGHSYAVLSLSPSAAHLLNPWGTATIDDDISPSPSDALGSFYLTLPSLRTMFNALHICVPSRLVSSHDTALQHSTPLSFTEPAACIFMLHADLPPSTGKPVYHNIGFRVEGSSMTAPLSSPVCALRQVSLPCDVGPGDYTVTVDQGAPGARYKLL
eukprot:gene9747-15132_t